MSKEATVERRHTDAALAVLKRQFGNWTEDVPLVAQLLANAEQVAAEKAWDEGYDEALMRPRGAVNPYRLAVKGGGNGE